MIFCFSTAKTYIVPHYSRSDDIFCSTFLSLSLCYIVIFPLRISSVLLRSFLQVSMFLLILLFQNRSLVVFPLLAFSFPICSEICRCICVWALLTAVLTFPTLLSRATSVMVILLADVFESLHESYVALWAGEPPGSSSAVMLSTLSWHFGGLLQVWLRRRVVYLW